MERRKSYEINSQNTILAIIAMLVGMVVLFWVAKSIFTLLAFIAPVLLVITLFINHRIVLNYGKWVLNLLKTNTLMGVVATLLTIIGFPVVSFLLFGRALLQRKVNKMAGGMFEGDKEEYADYQEVPDEVVVLELPPLEPEPERRVETEDTDYEELFD